MLVYFFEMMDVSAVDEMEKLFEDIDALSVCGWFAQID